MDGTTSSQQTTPVAAWTTAATPSSVAATANGSGSITVAWAGGPGDGAFTIYQSTDGTNYSSIGTASASSDSIIVGPSGLSDGVTYWFEVSAADVNNGGSTPNSDPNSATATPQPPASLTVTYASASGIALQWTNGDPTLDEVVQRSPAGAYDWATASGPTLNATTFTDTSVTSGTAYDYQVYSQDASGNVSPGVQVSAFAGTQVTPGTTQTIDAVVGQTYGGEVATFSGAGSATNLSATIFWDDGSTSPATITPVSGGGDAVSPVSGDTHGYANAGTYSGSVVIDDVGGSSPVGSADLPFTVDVASAPVTPGAAESVSAEEGIATQVASFTDPNDGGDDAQDMTATVVCSNGTTIAATVLPASGAAGSGTYSVESAFPNVGTYTGTVQIKDGDGQTASVNFTADVADGPLDAYGEPGSEEAAGPQTINPVAGQTFAGAVADFYDEAGAESKPADLSGTITWGDGQTSAATIVPQSDGGNYSVEGSNLYSAAGTHNGSVVVTDTDGSSVTMSFTADVLATAPLDAGNPETITATQGQSFTGEVATFFDEAGDASNAADLSATISWGDGDTSAATLIPIGSGGYSVQGSNMYAASGSLSGSVQVTEGSGTSAVSLPFTANVAASSAAAGPGLVLGSYTTISTNEGGEGFTGEVATFYDLAGGASNPSNLSATINWGDGNSSPATLVALGGGSYSVQGSNTYEDQVDFTGTVQVVDSVGGSANIGFDSEVGPYVALQPGIPETIYANTGQGVTAEVAEFYDTAGDNSDPSNFAATIDWGDGDNSEASLVPLGGGSYSVQGSETFPQAGSYAGTVTVTDQAGDGISIGFIAEVGSYGPSNNALPGGSGGSAFSLDADTADPTLYVAPSLRPGATAALYSSANPGLLSNALAYVASQRAAGAYHPTEEVTVHMDAGTYSLTPSATQAAVVEPIDVTTGDSYVTLVGARVRGAGGKLVNGVTISGGVTIDNWSPVPGIPSGDEYQAMVPATLGVFRNLYVQSGGGYVGALRAQSPGFGPAGGQRFDGYDANTYGTIHDDQEWMPVASGTAGSTSTVTTITDTTGLSPTGSYVGDYVTISGNAGFFGIVTAYNASTQTITFSSAIPLTSSPAGDVYSVTPFATNAIIPTSDYPNLLADFQHQGSPGVPGPNPLEFVEIHSYNETRLLISNVVRDGSDWILSFSNIGNLEPQPAEIQNTGYYIDNYVASATVGPGAFVPSLSPGQWYEDYQDGVVYYAPPSPTSAPISAVAPAAIAGGGSMLQIGQSFSSPSSAVTHFTISDVNFSFASWTAASGTTPAVSAGGYVGGQEGTFTTAPNFMTTADGGAPGATRISQTYSTEVPAVSIADATGTTITGCGFSHLDGAGLGLICQTKDTHISGNTFSDISGNAILVDGVQSYQDLSAVPAGYTSIAQFASSGDFIESNIIDDCGVEFADAAGILVGFANDLTISGNTLYDLPSAGIAGGRNDNSFNGESESWDYGAVNPVTGEVNPAPTASGSAGTWCLCNINTYNTITNVGLVMADAGGIYLSGCNWDYQNNMGTFIQGNRINSVQLYNNLAVGLSGQSGDQHGIYVDTGANGVSVLSNTLSDVEGQYAVFLNGVNLPNLFSEGSFPYPPIIRPPGVLSGLTIDTGPTAPSVQAHLGGPHRATATEFWAFGNKYDNKPYPVTK